MNAYAPILVLGALGAGFAIFSVVMATLIGPKRYNRAKLEAYECGIEPTPHAGRRRALPDQVLPDGDALHRLRHRDRLPLPLGRHLRRPRVFGLVEMLLFVLTVFVAYAYVWRRGGLEWD